MDEAKLRTEEEQTMTTAADKKRMEELIAVLTEASKAYYAQDREIMSNFEYDRLYDELEALEQKTGITLEGSPTVSVGYEAAKQLPKEAHERPMLSLAKTKSREELVSWLADQEGLLSWKLDGLTIVLTYENGVLQKAVTRGNGEIGEVITENAKTFVNLPVKIPYQGRLILRGEAVIPYSVFERINAEIPEEDARYKNPRNLCSGSVRQLSSDVTAKRQVSFYAFTFVRMDPPLSGTAGEDGFSNDRENQFRFLKEQGFAVVDYLRVTAETLQDGITDFANRIQTYDVPSDGLVLTLCDLAYAASLGRTAKFPRDSIAFKWADETAQTTLRGIEWSPSRTGLINPVALFDPVELEGTTVSRASVHNVSMIRQLKLGAGDQILVYKANMIIPQIAENLTMSDTLLPPEYCPACGAATELRTDGATVLYCTDPACPAKKIKAYTLFTSRNAMNVEGLSEATLEKFLGMGLLHEFADLYHLSEHRDVITKMEGFGDKSFDNLIAGIEKSRQTTMPRLLYALGISGIGVENAKLLSRHFDYDLDALAAADAESLSAIDRIGDVLGKNIESYFAVAGNREALARLLSEVQMEKPAESEEEASLAGVTFVVTGSLNHFPSRNELKSLIEQKGGKVTGSVTGNTDYLINNDINSGSGKNKKAKELGVPIIDEEAFLRMIGEDSGDNV